MPSPIAVRGIWQRRRRRPTRTWLSSWSARRVVRRRAAAALTGDSTRRADRALAAAEASLGAGTFDVALGLLATAEVGALDELQRARLDLLRAEAAYSESRGSEAPALLLRAAQTLEPLD